MTVQFIHNKKEVPLWAAAPALITIVGIWADSIGRPFHTPEEQGIAIGNYYEYAAVLN